MDKFVSIGRNITIADKYFKLYLRNVLQPYNINATEGIVLLMMYRKSSGNTQDELIKDIHYDKGVMARTMKELEEKGYVERNQNPLDSRSFIFSLTEKGHDFKHILIDFLRQWNKKLISDISEEHLAIVEASLEIMAQNSLMCFIESSQKHNKKRKGNKI